MTIQPLFSALSFPQHMDCFHFWKGGSLNKLILYVVLAWLGFWIAISSAVAWLEFCRGRSSIRHGHLGSLIVLVPGIGWAASKSPLNRKKENSSPAWEEFFRFNF